MPTFCIFLRTSKTGTLALYFDYKMALFGPNYGSIAQKKSKDSKNGVKSYHSPLNRLVLGNPPKNMLYRYFKVGPWKF